MSRKRAFVLLLSLFLLVFMVTGAVASNRWGCWKYANYAINWYNGGSGDYWYIYNEEARTDSNSWHNYTDISLTSVSAAGSTDHVNAYAGSYGSTGWLGIAEIQRYSGCTVYQGRSRLNRSYLDNGSYTRTNKKHVACQEVGHLFGLQHNRSSSTTCMNDTILSAPYPNSHDQSMINSIY
ncbi:MAG TPA: hypothetical protein VNA69_13150 [Thermoanaerobaculia bacterium]|nr:hypothetical protein [Thermoanaerobaculia bacterium]